MLALSPVYSHQWPLNAAVTCPTGCCVDQAPAKSWVEVADSQWDWEGHCLPTVEAACTVGQMATWARDESVGQTGHQRGLGLGGRVRGTLISKLLEKNC